MTLYSKEINQRFFNPEHVDLAEEHPEFRVFSHSIGSIEQGTWIRLRVWLNAKNGIEYAKFKVYGDPIVIAACELICEHLIQGGLVEAAHFNLEQIAEVLSVPAQSLDKLIWVKRAYLGVINDCNR